MRMAAGQQECLEQKLPDIEPGSAVMDVLALRQIDCRLVVVGVEPTGTGNGNTNYCACFG